MSESTTPDLSRIIGLIMENPKLIEEISSLAKTDLEKSEKRSAEQAESTIESSAVETEKEPFLQTEVVNSAKKRRTELLSAFKPYVSSERRKAIDSMISIANVLDAIRR